MATPCCFLHLLGPASVHDHSYTRTSEPPDHPLPRHTVVLPSSSENIIKLPVKEEMERFEQEISLSSDEIKEVERNTQSDNPITASVCGKILQRPTRTTAHEILYPNYLCFYLHQFYGEGNMRKLLAKV